ncbi:E3 ubiquitin ligase PQT3-like [Silene latifolia]|uniref:E3 ubiquitin ligase PQT3-like n=1 Tax=Silene latifolia TaxID=37657 RepID=UPI003D785BD5
MAVYYKFKSAKKYDSITIVDHFITVLNLKQRIFESKHMIRRGTDLIVTNAQTNEEYVDELMLIPKNTSVSVRRVPGPGPPPMPIVIHHPAESGSVTADSSMSNNSEPLDYYDDFGDDIYVTTPQVTATESSILMKDSTFGRGCGLQQKTPPQGYICHRCKIPGHYIQHCPTNGDPNFDIRKVKPPTGLPKSMLVPTPDGLYALANGTSVAFEKQIASQSSTRSIVNVPPELNCPLCNQVMKDAGRKYSRR